MKVLQSLFLFWVFDFCHSYKILAVFPLPAHSHYTLSYKLVSELAKRGHEVTYVTPYPQKTPTKNIKEVSLEDIIKRVIERKRNLWDLDGQSVFENVPFITNFGYLLTKDTLENKNIQKLLQTQEKYDLVILPQFLNEALLGIAYHFKAPLVLLSSMPLFPWANPLLAQPTSSAYSPNILTEYTFPLSFWQRVLNFVYASYSVLYHQWIILPKHRELVKKYIPGEPDLYNFLNNASLLLMNTHVSSNEAQPQPPNTIEIGGFHLKEPKKLPEDLQKFLDNSAHGVIIFSMGSNLKSSDLPDFKREALLKAFSKLKQDVLWKWEADELPGQPKNVKLMKWLPQSDILAHPNVQTFITHGGLLSTTESIYHGVPVIGIPIFADQKMNMATAVSHGYGVTVPFQQLSEERLTAALNEVLNNSKYKDNAVRRSKILLDRPLKPIDEAIYWIEYVIKHQGARHLRYPGMDLTWYQRNLLDVLVLVSYLVVLACSVLLMALKSIKKWFFYKKDKIKKND